MRLGHGHWLNARRRSGGGVVGAIPVNTGAPVITGDAIIGSTLTFDVGTWTNSPTTFEIEVRVSGGARNGTVLLARQTVTAVSTGTITPLAGESVVLQAWATNGAGTGTATSAAFGPFAAGFVATGADFDGSTMNLSRTTYSVAGSNQGILSLWFQYDGTDWNTPANQRIINIGVGTTNALSLRSSTLGRFALDLTHDGDGTDTLTVGGSGAFVPGNVYHIMVAWLLDTTTRSNSRVQVYVNDAVLATSPAYNPGTTGDLVLNDTITRLGIAAQATNADRWNGKIGEVYVNLQQTLDLSVTANRRLFVTATGEPVDLGTDGSTPTGSAPAFYIRGDGAAFNNVTTAGTLTVNGTPGSWPPPIEF